MINDIITQVGNNIRETLAGFFNLNWIPEVWFWYWWLFVLFLICGAIIWFFGWSKIVRMVASIGFLFAAVFVAGGAVMAKRMKDREESGHKPEPPPTPAQRPSEEPWRWPWDTKS